MNKENCALKLIDERILYYDAWLKKHKKKFQNHVSQSQLHLLGFIFLFA